jgi:nucleotide-binding universal stress UspA family protein
MNTSSPNAVAVCAVDDDPYAADVVATGKWLASALDLEPLFVHVLRDDSGRRPAALADDLGLALDQARVVAAETPAQGILRAVDEHAARLVVMGSRGQGAVASAVMGSATRRVVASRQVPVVVVRAGSLPVRFGGPVLCGIADDSADEVAVARAAGRIASRLDVPLVLVHALEFGAYRTGSARLPGPRVEGDRRQAEHKVASVVAELPAGLQTEVRIRDGSAAATVVAVADERSADLIVLGHRARGALATVVTGSTALEVIAEGGRTTMLLPPQLAAGLLTAR